MKKIIKNIFLIFGVISLSIIILTSYHSKNQFLNLKSNVLVEYNSNNISELKIIIVGYEYNDSGIMVACYWENGQKITLTDGRYRAYAGAIASSGDDILIAGYENNESSTMVACYWENGQKITLTDGQNHAAAHHIAINRNDVYISGYEQYYFNRNEACYWKNGQKILLTDSRDNNATDIAVSENDIFIINGLSSSNSAFYWKNGQKVVLSDTDVLNSCIRSLSLTENDIYFGGYVNLGMRPGLGSIDACYWKNGNRINLPNVTYYDYSSSIVISGNDVYILGGKFGQDDNIVWYWKNVEIILLENNNKFARTTDMVIDGNDVYITGFIENNNDEIVACFWKNGELNFLTDGRNSSQASAIIVLK